MCRDELLPHAHVWKRLPGTARWNHIGEEAVCQPIRRMNRDERNEAGFNEFRTRATRTGDAEECLELLGSRRT